MLTFCTHLVASSYNCNACNKSDHFKRIPTPWKCYFSAGRFTAASQNFVWRPVTGSELSLRRRCSVNQTCKQILNLNIDLADLIAFSRVPRGGLWAFGQWSCLSTSQSHVDTWAALSGETPFRHKLTRTHTDVDACFSNRHFRNNPPVTASSLRF